MHTAEGWLYLAVVLDLWSRRVVGYATSRFIDRHLVISAIRNAIGQRTLQPATIFHSDRGSQYASDDFIDLLRQHRITQSMSRKGDCWDNAPSESFFSTLKQEGLQRTYATRRDAQDDIDSFMLWYNAHRLHSFLQYRSPMAFEAHAMSLAACLFPPHNLRVRNLDPAHFGGTRYGSCVGWTPHELAMRLRPAKSPSVHETCDSRFPPSHDRRARTRLLTRTGRNVSSARPRTFVVARSPWARPPLPWSAR